MSNESYFNYMMLIGLFYAVIVGGVVGGGGLLVVIIVVTIIVGWCIHKRRSDVRSLCINPHNHLGT